MAPLAVLDRWGRLEARPRVVLGTDLEVIWSNDAAEAAMAQGGDIALVDGRFRLQDANEMAQFRRFIESSTEAVSAWCSIQAGGGALLFRVWRVEAEGAVSFGVVFHPAGASYAPHWADFSRVFGLTHSEFRVALRLLDGMQIEAVADELGIAPGTARIHVRNLYGKLNVSSREAMFRLLAPFRVA
ncbi:MAG: helix-turn-helix transcriptional regulator [Pseudomonadota bacterium]